MATESSLRVPIGLRVPPEALEEIDARAAQRGMNRTEYMIQAALGQLDGQDLTVMPRLDSHDARLERLERLVFGDA